MYIKFNNQSDSVELITCVFSYMSEAKSRALDNLGRVYARIGNFQKAIDVYVFSELSNSPIASGFINVIVASVS